MNQRSISSLPKKIENLHLDENCYADVSSSFIHNCKNLEATHMFSNRWMNKLWFISVTAYYSATKRNKLMIQAATGLNLKCITLSERNQTQKPGYCVIALKWLWKRPNYRDGEEVHGCWVRVGGQGEVVRDGGRVGSKGATGENSGGW